MHLTPAQLQTVKADIAANPDLNQFPNNSDGNLAIAQLYNLNAVPDYWVWRTNVSRAEIYNLTSPVATTWNWTTYKNQGVAEQNAWVQMFMGDVADFSKANLRAGIGAIFTGSQQANDQRDHCLAMGKRKAWRIEKLLAVGNGQQATPSTMTAEGPISADEVQLARNS